MPVSDKREQRKEKLQVYKDDDWITRIQKHFPVEITALYIALQAVFTVIENEKTLQIILWIVIGVCIALTPLYKIFMQNVKKVGQNIIAGIAFITWSMAMGGAAWEMIPYARLIGMAVVILCTSVVFPLILSGAKERGAS